MGRWWWGVTPPMSVSSWPKQIYTPERGTCNQNHIDASDIYLLRVPPCMHALVPDCAFQGMVFEGAFPAQ